MSDIVVQLRVYGGGAHRLKAANEIERLRADVVLLREALTALVPVAEADSSGYTIEEWQALENVRTTLEQTKP